MSHADNLRQLHQQNLDNFRADEKQALDLLTLISQLRDDKDIIFSLFGEPLDSLSMAQIVSKVQQSATHNNGKPIQLVDIIAFVKQFADRVNDGERIETVNIDLGQVLVQKLDVNIVLDSIKKACESAKPNSAATDVVLYGFGRIGRILTRLLSEKSASDKGLQIKAIVVRPAKIDNDIQKRASLLKRDSVHGTFAGSVDVDTQNNGIIVNGRFIQLIYANDPSEIDYTSYGIDNAIVIDNTGIWKDKDGLGKHLQAKGVQKVLLTAPAKDGIKNVVYNVNHNSISEDNIVSAASCTTNAITPTLKVINDEYGIDTGHVETVHAFTNDQNLIDNYHKSDRRGRSAVLNMVITSTGAAKAVGKALPELEGKLTGNAIRVPTPNVSLAILNLNLKTAPSNADALNQFLKQTASSTTWQSQIAYSDSSEAVSTDFVGTKQVGIIDSLATIVTDNHATVYIWYDNEVGYSTQVLRVVSEMAGVHYTTIPA